MFVKTYLDENVSVLLAELLHSRGFEALTAQEAGNKGLRDDQQLEFATSNGMAILTHDRVDFEALAKDYFANGKSHQGMIIAYRRRPQFLAERVVKVINRITADEMVNQIIYI